MSQNFYDLKDFLNFQYAVKERVHTYIADRFFNGDKSRVVYASNDYAFRARQDQNKTDSGLNFPFANFKMKPSGNEILRERGWYNSAGFMEGIFIDEIQKKVRLVPVRYTFDFTVFYNRYDDLTYAFEYILLPDDMQQTQLFFSIEIDGKEFNCLIEYDFESIEKDPTYQENDWLTKNKIHTISCSIVCDTHIYRTDTKSKYCIPEKVLFDFYHSQNGGFIDNPDIALEFLQSSLSDD